MLILELQFYLYLWMMTYVTNIKGNIVHVFYMKKQLIWE